MKNDSTAPPHHPRRPTRLDRVYVSGPIYFVTFNTYRRIRCLACTEIHTALVEFCRRAELHAITVGRYVVMPDHIHLFVAMPEIGGTSLSNWVRTLKTVLGKVLLTAGIDKPHWQEGFFDHLLRHEESHAQKWEYVSNNPVRAGLCRESHEWPFQGEIVTI